MHLRIAIVLTFSLYTAGCAQSDANNRAHAMQSMKAILQDALAESRAPGLGAVVTTSKGLLGLQAVGVRRIDGEIALEPTDPFHIGSVAKTFTATIMAKLVEADKLAWETPVTEVLTDNMQSAHSAYTGITLSHLLSHEAGLQPMVEESEFEQVPELTGDVRSQRRQFAQWVLQLEPTIEPFVEYRYSNAHFVIAASMAETVSGRSWEDLVAEHLFATLNMRRAGFGWAGKQGESVPWGHTFADGTYHLVDPNGDYQLPRFFAAAGDVHASLPDMANFFQAYLKSWNGSGDYLRKETLEHIFTRRLKGGLGWGLSTGFGYEPVATYSGSADTFLMVVALFPDADIGVAVVANAYSEEVEKVVVGVLLELIEHYVPEYKESDDTK